MLVDHEKLEVLNAQGRYTGEVKGKREVHAAGDYHPCVHFFVTDGQGSLLAQFRGPRCSHMRDVWDAIGWAGHVSARTAAMAMSREPQLDSVLQAFDAGIREGTEEMGVTGLTRQIIHTEACRHIGITRTDFTTEDGWQDRTLAHNFLLHLPDFNPSNRPLEKDKVLDVRWMSIDREILPALDGQTSLKLANRPPDHQWMLRLACAAAKLMQAGY